MTYMWALYAREVRRFQKLWLDTIFSPVVSIVLYLAVFGIVVGSRSVEGVNYPLFVYAGLLTMAIVNGSFQNPAFALVIAKNVGTIIDLQIVPLAPWRIGLAYAMAAMTRAVVTFIVAFVCTVWFVPDFHIAHPLWFLIGLLLTGLEFGLLGVVFGLWAKGFEALTFMMTFVLQPMIFLAGVFYPISSLPHPWNLVSAWNPLHHNITVIRYAITGYADIAPTVSLGVVCGALCLVFLVMRHSAGKSLKA